MNHKQAGLLAGVGLIVGLIPVISVIGLVLYLIGLKRLSVILRKNEIFRYALISFIVGLVLSMLGALIAFSVTFTTHAFEAHSQITIGNPFLSLNLTIASLFGLLASIIVFIYSSKIFKILYEIFLVDSLKKASSFYKWGTYLAILGVGELLAFIAQIFAIVGLFSLPETYSIASSEVEV